MTGTLPRPAFDPELDAVLMVLADQLPPTLTAEMIPSMRQPTPAEATDEMLREHDLTCRDLTIPGYRGEDIVISVIARRDHQGTGPGIYHTHGGGMVAGDRFSAGPCSSWPGPTIPHIPTST